MFEDANNFTGVDGGLQRTPFTYLNKPERVQGLNDAVDTLVCAIASDNEIPDLCDKSGICIDLSLIPMNIDLILSGYYPYSPHSMNTT